MTDLMEVTDKLIGYMSGKEPDLVIEVEVAGERREFFNQKEKAHMVDVKNLMILTIQIRNFALLGFALTLIAYCALKPFSLRTLLSSLRLVVGIGAGLLAILAALMWHSFDKVFVAFHELFFNNDLWLLDYNTDLLLNIVPQDFFIDISMFIGCIFAALVAVAIAATTAGLRYSRMA
jgi:integral membrane protein (TIGR01906 family)